MADCGFCTPTYGDDLPRSTITVLGQNAYNYEKFHFNGHFQLFSIGFWVRIKSAGRDDGEGGQIKYGETYFRDQSEVV